MTLPNSPAMMHATSGDKTMVRYMDCISILALKGIEIFDVDAAAFAEQHHQNREANSGLGRRDGQDEKDEYLPADVAAETRESHEIEIHRQQHEFDAHQQHDDVLRFKNTPATAMANKTPDKASTWVREITAFSLRPF